MTTSDPAVPPGAALQRPLLDGEPIELGKHLWGFGGAHGGLVVAMLTTAMHQQAPDSRMHSVTARFHRPIRGPFHIETEVVRAGTRVTTFTARAVSDRGVLVDACAVFGAPRASTWPTTAPPAPPSAPLDELPVVGIPAEFVPVGATVDIRAVNDNRPYAGCDEPELIAWIRLIEDDEPPSPHRFIFLMDAFAPSYAAVLTSLSVVPTVELTVRPSEHLAEADSPWVLLRARTRAATADGWVDELIDAWSLDGSYLGSAQQLRLVRDVGGSAS